MMEVRFLGSGSSGNATLVRYGLTTVLLDCGFSGRELKRRLEKAGTRVADISAVLITHEHSDHVSGLPLFKRRADLPVFISGLTLPAVRFGSRAECRQVEVRGGCPFSVGEIEIFPFNTSHDALDPVGYAFKFPDGTRLGIATDLGHANPEAVDALAGCDWIGLEANHDPDMLAEGPYPPFLKQRIRSDIGHLSNLEAADLLKLIATKRLRHLFALHMSRTNNRQELAKEALSSCLKRMGLEVPVTVIDQDP